MRCRLRVATVAAIGEAREKYRRVDGSILSQAAVIRAALVAYRRRDGVNLSRFSHRVTRDNSTVVNVPGAAKPEGVKVDAVVGWFLDLKARDYARLDRRPLPPVTVHPGDEAISYQVVEAL